MTYVHVVGMKNAGLSDMLSRRGFGGELWGKPLRKVFPHYVLRLVCKVISLMNFDSLALCNCLSLQSFLQKTF